MTSLKITHLYSNIKKYNLLIIMRLLYSSATKVHQFAQKNPPDRFKTKKLTMTSDERKVKSVVLKAFGDYENIQIEQIPLGPPKADEVEVDVQYCGVNFCDIVSRIGLVGQKVPFILGIECAGTISSLGPQSSQDELPKLKIGDRVVCFNFFGGLYREKVVARRKSCYLIPDNLSLKEAAAVFVNYLTAYCCLFELGNLRQGHNVLIKSCAGGVGWAATQLAKTIPGVTVHGTCSESKRQQVLENGVDRVHSYSIEEICKSNATFDLIIENEAVGDFTALRSLLRPLGMIVAIGANNIIEDTKKLSMFDYVRLWWSQRNLSMQELMMFNRAVSGLHLGILAEQNPVLMQKIFKKIGRLIQTNKIKPRIDSEWDLDDIVKATKKLGERKNIGKIVIRINNKPNKNK